MRNWFGGKFGAPQCLHNVQSYAVGFSRLAPDSSVFHLKQYWNRLIEFEQVARRYQSCDKELVLNIFRVEDS